MSIMSDARLRLLEARIAEIERRLTDGAIAASAAARDTGPPPAPARRAKKAAPKARKRSRKMP